MFILIQWMDDIILVLEERGGFILGIKFIKLNNDHSGVVKVLINIAEFCSFKVLPGLK